MTPNPGHLPAAPSGFRLDPFADARLGLSLFQLQPEDWFVPIIAGEDGAPAVAPAGAPVPPEPTEEHADVS